MAEIVRLPQVDENFDEYVLNGFAVEVGASVRQGQTLVEVETDKASLDVPSPVSGVLLHRFHADGATLRPGDAIAVVGEEGEHFDSAGFAAEVESSALAMTADDLMAAALGTEDLGTPYTVHVRGLVVHAYHGVYEDERRDGRRFEVDLDVDVVDRGAGESDALGDTVDYRNLASVVMEVLEGPSHFLIESLAEEMCQKILGRISVVQRVWIQIRKHATGVPGDPSWVGVTVERRRVAP